MGTVGYVLEGVWAGSVWKGKGRDASGLIEGWEIWEVAGSGRGRLGMLDDGDMG